MVETDKVRESNRVDDEDGEDDEDDDNDEDEEHDEPASPRKNDNDCLENAQNATENSQSHPVRPGAISLSTFEYKVKLRRRVQLMLEMVIALL